MKNHIKTISILCATTVFFSCKKEKPPISIPGVGCSSTNCPEMYEKRTSEYPDTLHFTNSPPNCMTMFEETYNQKWIYSGFSVNPNNKFEFAVVRYNPNELPSSREICIYNFCKNEIKVISNDALGSTSWSIHDWILYVGYDLNLYRIKADGTLKETFNNSGTAMRPIWSPNGNKFIYKNITDNPNRLRICNEEGEIIKSIIGNFKSWNWINDSEIIYTDDGYIKTFDIESENVSIIMNQPIEDLENLENVGLIPINDKIYFNSFEGLYVLENNGEKSLLETSYLSYDIIDVHVLDSKNLMFNRATIDTSAYPCTTKVTFYNSIYDIETQSERYIKKLTELK